MKRVPAKALLLSALIASSATAAPEANAQPDNDATYDRYGRLVYSSETGRVNYSAPGEAAAPQAASAISSLAVSPQAAIGDPSQPDLYGALHRFGIFGSGIGASGISAINTDNDKRLELILGGSTETFDLNNFWYVLDYSAAAQEYQIRWTSPLSTSGITALQALHLPGVGGRILVGHEDGTIEVVDARSKAIDTTFSVRGGRVNRILLVDANNDGVRDLVVLTPSRISLFNPQTFALVRSVPYGGSDLAVGNVDKDAREELVLNTGYVLQLVGASTTKVKWNYGGDGFGAKVLLADVDADSKQEIIGVASWYYITSFDADLKSPKWQINAAHDIDAAVLADVTGDGKPELLYGDGQSGGVHAIDLATRTELWAADDKRESGVTNITVLDTDGDDQLELIFGAGYSDTGPDILYIRNLSDRALEWSSTFTEGPIHALDVGDVDNDGEKEIVFATRKSGFDDGRIYVYNAATWKLEWVSPGKFFAGFAVVGINDLAIGDVDGDGANELVVGTDRLYDGRIHIIDVANRAIKETYSLDQGSPIHSVAIGDVDADGVIEIVAGGGRHHTGAPGNYIYVLNGQTGEEEWKSVNIGSYWGKTVSLVLGNPDRDAAVDIAAVNDYAYLIDGITHQQWSSPGATYHGLALYNLMGTAKQEIILGRADGRAVVLDGDTKARLDVVPLCSTTVYGLRGWTDPTTKHRHLFFGCDGVVGVYDYTAGSLVWSGPASGQAGYGNNIKVMSLYGNAWPEIMVGGPHALSLFSVGGR